MIDVSRSEFDRALGTVSDSIGGVAEAELKSAEQAAKDARLLRDAVLNASAISAVDLLTSDEIRELRSLIAADDPASLARERMRDAALAGMYAQLSDIGLLRCFTDFDGNLTLIDVDPKAAWAICRRELRNREAAELKEAAERRRAEDRAHDRRNMILGWFAGAATTLIASLLTGLGRSIGLPLG